MKRERALRHHFGKVAAVPSSGSGNVNLQSCVQGSDTEGRAILNIIKFMGGGSKGNGPSQVGNRTGGKGLQGIWVLHLGVTERSEIPEQA